MQTNFILSYIYFKIKSQEKNDATKQDNWSLNCMRNLWRWKFYWAS